MDPATNPTPVPDGTPIDELIARRERKRQLDAAEELDNGVRLASQRMWDEVLRIGSAPVTDVVEAPGSRFDGLGADSKPEPIAAEVDEEFIGKVAAKVAHFRADAAADLKALDKRAPRHIHIEAQAVLAKLDDFLATVSDHFRGVQS